MLTNGSRSHVPLPDLHGKSSPHIESSSKHAPFVAYSVSTEAKQTSVTPLSANLSHLDWTGRWVSHNHSGKILKKPSFSHTVHAQHSICISAVAVCQKAVNLNLIYCHYAIKCSTFSFIAVCSWRSYTETEISTFRQRLETAQQFVHPGLRRRWLVDVDAESVGGHVEFYKFIYLTK